MEQKTRLIDLTTDQLHDIVVDAVGKLLPTTHVATGSQPRFLKASEAAAYLKIDVKTLYAKVSAGQIVACRPPHSSMRFTTQALDDFLLSRRSDSEPSIEFVSRKSR